MHGKFSSSQHSPNPTRLTSTERIFPSANNKGCMLRSGSLRKQLGFAWCWKCQWFHQLAGAPCKTMQMQEASLDIYFLTRQGKIWVQGAQLFLSPNAMPWLRAHFHEIHLQMSNHKFVNPVVPFRLAKDRKMSKIMLQPTGLGLENIATASITTTPWVHTMLYNVTCEVFALKRLCRVMVNGRGRRRGRGEGEKEKRSEDCTTINKFNRQMALDLRRQANSFMKK